MPLPTPLKNDVHNSFEQRRIQFYAHSSYPEPKPPVKKAVPPAPKSTLTTIRSLVGSIKSSGRAILTLTKNPKPQTFLKTTQLLSIFLAAIDFLLLPSKLLARLVMGHRLDLDRPTLKLWAFSTFSLGLTTLILFVPSIGPFVGASFAAIALISSVWAIAKFTYLNHKYKHKIVELNGFLQEEIRNLNGFQKDLEKLQKEYCSYEYTKEEKHDKRMQIEGCISFIKNALTTVETLCNEKELMQTKLEKVSNKQVRAKLFELFFNVLAIGVFVLAIAFPPVGLPLMITTSIVSGTLLLVNDLILPSIKYFSNKNRRPSATNEEIELTPLNTKDRPEKTKTSQPLMQASTTRPHLKRNTLKFFDEPRVSKDNTNAKNCGNFTYNP